MTLHQESRLNFVTAFFSILTSEPIQLGISRPLATTQNFPALHNLGFIVTKVRLERRGYKFFFLRLLEQEVIAALKCDILQSLSVSYLVLFVYLRHHGLK